MTKTVKHFVEHSGGPGTLILSFRLPSTRVVIRGFQSSGSGPVPSRALASASASGRPNCSWLPGLPPNSSAYRERRPNGLVNRSPRIPPHALSRLRHTPGRALEGVFRLLVQMRTPGLGGNCSPKCCSAWHLDAVWRAGQRGPSGRWGLGSWLPG